MHIPFYSFEYQHGCVREQALKIMQEVFDAQWYILGKYLNAFEQEYAAFNQVNYCVGVANGLDALQISLKVLGIGPGDEVIVPSNTYIATWLAVSAVGATIVPVEPNLSTYNIDPENIEKAITAKTKAIIPVHLYGQACEMDATMAIANKYKLFVIEDNAQAQGGSFNGQLTGSFGHLNATSFYPTKNLGAIGDAGAITTTDEYFAHKVQVYRNYGSENKYYNEVLGVNSRLDELQAAILSLKLPYLKQWTEERIKIASLYNYYLKDIVELDLPTISKGATHVYHLYVVRTKRRGTLQKFLHDNGVSTAIHYPIPPHLQLAYQNLGFSKGDFPVAEEIAESCLSLPLWPGLNEEQISYICSKIREFFYA